MLLFCTCCWSLLQLSLLIISHTACDMRAPRCEHIMTYLISEKRLVPPTPWEGMSGSLARLQTTSYQAGKIDFLQMMSCRILLITPAVSKRTPALAL